MVRQTCRARNESRCRSTDRPWRRIRQRPGAPSPGFTLSRTRERVNHRRFHTGIKIAVFHPIGKTSDDAAAESADRAAARPARPRQRRAATRGSRRRDERGIDAIADPAGESAAIAAIARTVNRAWLRQPSRRPTTAHSASSARPHVQDLASGGLQPPTPSTTTASALFASRVRGQIASDTAMPASRAASCGAVGSGNAKGLRRRTAARDGCGHQRQRILVPPTLRHASQPLATGFMPTAQPRARSACSNATVAKVLLTPVSCR